MSSVKEKLIERIKSYHDEDLLNELYKVLLSEEQEPLQFTKEQKNKIKDSEQQYQAGKTVSDDDVQKRMNKWLDK